MTQGPWSVKGIDPRARSVAREMAQRRGITLGQYLNTLLLDEDEEEELAILESAPVEEPIPPQNVQAPDELRRITEEIDSLAQRLEASQQRSAKAISGVDKSILDLHSRVETSSKDQLETLERVSRAMSEIEITQSALRERVQLLETDASSHATVTALQELETSLGRLSKAVEERANAAPDFEQINAAISEHVQSSTNLIDNRVSHIDQKINSVESKMDSALSKLNATASRIDLFEDKTERSVAETAKLMERALDANASRTRTMSKDLLEKVDSIEEQTRNAVNSLGDAVSRIINRLDTSEAETSGAIRSIEKSVSGIDDRFARLENDNEQDFDRLETHFQKRLDTLAESLAEPMKAVREDVEQRLQDALHNSQPEYLDEFQNRIGQVQKHLNESESRQANAIVSMSQQVERLSEAFDSRLMALEAGGENEDADTLRAEMLDLTQRIEERLTFIEADRRVANGSVDSIRKQFEGFDRSIGDRLKIVEQNTEEALNGITETVADLGAQVQKVATQTGKSNGAEFEKLAERIDERVRESERRSAEAITQIGEQVARVAERLQTQHAESLRSLENRLATSEKSHTTKLNEALSDMSRRLQEIGDDATAVLQPVHKQVSSLAQRIADLEDKGPVSHQSTVDAPRITPDALGDDEDPNDLLIIDDQNEDDIERVVETRDVVGIEPPPFDESTDVQLFGDSEEDDPPVAASREKPKPADQHKSRPNTDKPPAAEAATRIDDLLDVDDVVLQPEAAKASTSKSEFTVDLPPRRERPEETGDYLSRARKAAISGNRVLLEPDMSTRKGLGKGPLVASAALAIAVAGGGAWTVMRGKQDESGGNDTSAKQDPSAPLSPLGDSDAAAAVLFSDAGNADAEPAADLLETSAQSQTIQTTFADEPAMTLEKAVAARDPAALYDSALELLQTGEKVRAVSMLKEAAADGLVIASYRLAKLHERGEGVPRDMAASRRWTEQAAIGGNVRAMHDLAVFYAEGDAGPQSYAAAVEWFRQASDLGLVDSQYNLAVLFEQGLGVSEDKSEAAFWFEVAGRGGDSDALRRARGLLSEMPDALAEQVRRRARTFSPKASNAKANGDLGVRAWEQPSTSQIAEMQRLLNQLGYSAGEPDGNLGSRTSQAIRAFETAQGREPRGEATMTILRQLRTVNAR